MGFALLYPSYELLQKPTAIRKGGFLQWLQKR